MTWQHVVLTCIGVICLTALLWHALDLHVDGAILASGVGVIAGALGIIAPIRSPFEPPAKS